MTGLMFARDGAQPGARLSGESHFPLDPDPLGWEVDHTAIGFLVLPGPIATMVATSS